MIEARTASLVESAKNEAREEAARQIAEKVAAKLEAANGKIEDTALAPVVNGKHK